MTEDPTTPEETLEDEILPESASTAAVVVGTVAALAAVPAVYYAARAGFRSIKSKIASRKDETVVDVVSPEPIALGPVAGK